MSDVKTAARIEITSRSLGENRGNKRDILSWLVSGVVGVMSIATFALAVAPPDAEAIPSFARQTGQPCATCHTGFPQLTPFGRRFKLGGYTAGGGMSLKEAPPLAAMILPTFTRTNVRQDTPPTNPNGYPIAHTNDNLVMQQASLFYGGQIYGNLGAFIQGTYDKASQHTYLDNTDIRYADTTKLFSLDVLYGVDVNNGPTVQDVWNTTPAWGYPFVSATLAPQFSPPGTLIEGGFAGRSVGTGGYLFLNDMVYLEAAAYHNLSKGELNALGQTCANDFRLCPGVANGRRGGVSARLQLLSAMFLFVAQRSRSLLAIRGRADEGRSLIDDWRIWVLSRGPARTHYGLWRRPIPRFWVGRAISVASRSTCCNLAVLENH